MDINSLDSGAAARSINQCRRPTGRTSRCGKRPVSRLGASDDVPLFSSCHDECDIAAAVERRIGQRDARLGLPADDRDRPPPRLLQRRLTGEQRGGVSVVSDPKQRDVEQRPVGSKRVGAVEALQRRLVCGGGLVGRQALRRHRMDIVVGNRDPRQEGVARHTKIAVGMIVRHEPFIAPEPMRPVPRKARRNFRRRETLIETPGRRAAREATAKAPSLSCARLQSHSATSCASVSALSKVRLSVDARRQSLRQDLCVQRAVSYSGDRRSVIAGAKYCRSGNNRVSACGNGQSRHFRRSLRRRLQSRGPVSLTRKAAAARGFSATSPAGISVRQIRD